MEDIQIIIFVLVLFLLTGLFGGIGIWNILHRNKKRALWSFGIGVAMIVLYLITMFSFGLLG
ncbi:hypothetical protein [Halalkalibacter krulwichiae]|uniref:Uncharacterized protein n=1 Tax=Halalkalibacter krulwichiae TaxID=199441 RepID=A0A1X9MAD4_9BACI|nr:hypothetical protein [Halalkalibacter krulwichiae]ARK30385.1 hypothetical protein BkAM31D_11410 [Halalkalibacter krulwichiae]